MAVIKIEAKKDARSTQTICLVQGDRRTQILRFNVNRYDGGVDLMDLRWVIKTRNAAGVEDIYEPAAVEIGMTSITIDWLVDGSVTNDSGMADYELNGLDIAEDGEPIVWKGATGTISVRANIGPKFGETDGMTNIEKLILYVEGELEGVVEAGSAALDAAERANHVADVLGDPAEAVDRANAAAQRAETAAATVGDLEAAVNRANTAAAEALNASDFASVAASDARNAAARASEAAKNVENIEEATLAAHEAAETANLAAATAAEAALPHVQLYGRRVMGEVAKASGNPVTCLADAGSLLQPVTVLEPKQQGRGDPYPAGGGRNKSISFSPGTHNGVRFVVNGDGSVNVSGTATVETVLINDFYIPAGSYVVSGAPSGSSFAKYDMYIAQMHGDTGDNGTVVARSFDGTTETNFSFDTRSRIRFIIRVPAGAMDSTKVFYPMIRLASDPDSSYAPPSNIRPFIGYDKLDLHTAGKNLLSLKNLTNTVASNVNVAFYDNEISISPKAEGVGFQQWYGKMTIPESWRGKTFTYSVQSSVNESSASVLPKSFLIENDANGNEIGIAANLTVYPGVANSGSFVVKENTVSFTILFRADQYQMFPTGSHMWFGRIQLEESPVMTAFMPYQGTPHTVQIGQTVYGGRFDWLTGKLVAEWAMDVLDGSEEWIDSAALGLKVIFTPGSELPRTGVNAVAYMSHFKRSETLVLEAMQLNEFTFANSNMSDSSTLSIRTDMSIDEFKAYLAAQKAAGTPVQFVRKLATSIEIQLTPAIISAVEPEQTNTLYGDGSIEVEYVKPLHVSIEERVAAALAAAMQTE